jgi:aminoglycoside phosphotransferase (APT) family kinase protein
LARLLPSQAVMAECHTQLIAVSQAPIFEDVLQRLPVTLVHGDVHPGNIIRMPDGKSVLMDWGNARLAPAMLDLANVVAFGSANWMAYGLAWENAGGPALDPDLIRQGFYWAVAMVNLQYLPFATTHRVENVPRMVERIRDASDRLLA